MAWIGVAREIPEEEVVNTANLLGLLVRGVIGEVEIKTSKGWICLRIYDVHGDVEGIAGNLARIFNAVALESGRHLVLGETSARLWDEGAKVVFPDGEEELIPIYTYDGFLDVRMPTSNVKGLKATLVVGRKVYELPLGVDDLIEILSTGKKALEKVEKAASVYGLEKIISREAIEQLRQQKEETKVEIDYESGLALIKESGKVKIINVKQYFLDLIQNNELDKAKELLNKAPQSLAEELVEALRREYEVDKDLSEGEAIVKWKEIAKKLGIEQQLGLEEAAS
ncbi:MAG: hypothetical protein QW291_05990 [Thermofilaceae archaeon]